MAYTIAAPRKYPPRHITAYDGGLKPIAGTLDAVRLSGEMGSERLRKRLLIYGAKHGLPNLSTLQCITELRTLDRVLSEDLMLADKICREWGWR